MAMGTPQYGNTETTFYKNFKLKSPDAQKGETVFTLPDLRIVPPIHSLSEKGIWARYHGQHFGYAGNGKEPGKPKQRPFACIEQRDFRTKIVSVQCTACDTIEEKRAERDAREAEYKQQGKSESEVRDLLGPLTDWLKRHNCDRKWHINVMTRAGEFGVLQISHTLKKMLDVKIEELRTKKKVDPIAVNQGVWFSFSRMGKFPVTDAVDWVREVINDEGDERIVRCPLTEAQCEQAEKVCPDLQTGVVKLISAAQVNLIVACSGDPDEVDRIWAMGSKAAQTERSKPAVQTPPTKPAIAPVTSTATAHLDEMAKLRAQLAALEASTPTSDQIIKTAAQIVAPLPSDDDGEMTDAEFAAKWGKK